MFNNMLENWLVAIVLVALGACIFTRRNSFRTHWEGALTLSIVLQVIGFMLVMPLAAGYGRAMFYLTGVAHLRDLFADLMFISAAIAMVQACAMRLLPREHINWYMRRLEWPSLVVSLVMIVCLLSSNALGRDTLSQSFLDVACDGWLKAYWVAYGGMVIYSLCYLVRLLWVMRGDSRRRSRAVEVLIAAAVMGIAGTATHVIDVLDDDFTISAVITWGTMSAPSILAAYAAALSWRSRPRGRAGAR